MGSYCHLGAHVSVAKRNRGPPWWPLPWLVDVAGRSSPHGGGSAEAVGQALTQLGLTNLLLNKPLWAPP